MISVAVAANGGTWRVAVNDVPVFESFKPGGGHVTMPVRHYLRSGENVLTVQLKGGVEAARSPSVRLAATLFEHRLGDPAERFGRLAEVAMGPDPEQPWTGLDRPESQLATPIGLEQAGVQARQRFVLTGELPRWAWLNAVPIAPDPHLREALLAFYRNFWDLLQRQAITEIARLVRERVHELRIALEAGPDEVPDDMGLGRLLRGGSTPWPFDDKGAIVELSGDRRLARLIRWDGLPFLVLRSGDVGDYIDIRVRQGDGGWVITR